MKARNLNAAGFPPRQQAALIGDVTSVTPAGTVIANATAITLNASTVAIADAAATAGVQLPVPGRAGETIRLFNGGNNSTNVYPVTNGSIDNGTANAAVTMEPKSTAVFVALSAGSAANYSAHGEIATLVANVTPVGTTIGGAANVTASFTFLADAAANTGVILPANTTQTLWIVNGSANVTKVYPPVNGKINGIAANTSVSVAANTMVIARAYSTLDYGVTGIS